MNIMPKKNLGIQKTTYYILIFAFLASSFNCLVYARESVERFLAMSKMSYSGKRLFIEKTFKYAPVYELSLWLNDLIPDKYSYSIHNFGTDMYYNNKLDYYLYPKYQITNLPVEILLQYEQKDALKKLSYGDIILSVYQQPSSLKISKSGMYYITVNKDRYYLMAKYDDDKYLLIKEPFLSAVVLKNPREWPSLYREFRKLYPKKKLDPLFKGG